MTDRMIRGVGLLAAALIAALVLIANVANDGPEIVRQVASMVMVVGGTVGIVMIAWGLLRD